LSNQSAQLNIFSPIHIERVWSNTKYKHSSDSISFQAKTNQECTVIISVPMTTIDPNQELSLVIVGSCLKQISLAVRLGDSAESNRKNLLPFYAGGEYSIPINLLVDDGNNVFDKILFYVDGEFEIKSIFIRQGYKALKLKIMLFSGIGDCLRTISRNRSLSSYINKYPCDIYWSYAGHGLQDAGWSRLLQDFIFGRVKNYHYVSPEEFDKVDAFKLFNGYAGTALLSHYFKDEKQGINIELIPEEVAEIDSHVAGKELKIGIQLAGNDPKKNLKTSMLLELFKLIFEKYPNSNIFIIDAPSRAVDAELLADPRVVNLVGKTNLAQNIHLIQKMNTWIAPDSFSKYVANWSNTRQLILCCRLPYIEPKDMLVGAFKIVGLLFNKQVSILGIDYDDDLQILSCVDDASEISALEVFNQISYA